MMSPLERMVREVHIEEMVFELRHEKTTPIQEQGRQQHRQRKQKVKINEYGLLEKMKGQYG